MKAIFPALTCVDSPANELEGGLTKGEAKDAGPGFDALLAQATARTTEQSRAVKPLAPTHGPQPATAVLEPAALLAHTFGAAPVATGAAPQRLEPVAVAAPLYPQPATVEVVQQPEPAIALGNHAATPALTVTTPRYDGELPQEEMLEAQGADEFAGQAPAPVGGSLSSAPKPEHVEPVVLPAQPGSPDGVVSTSPSESRESTVTKGEQPPLREASAETPAQPSLPAHPASPIDPRQGVPAEPAPRAEPRAAQSDDELVAPATSPTLSQPSELGKSRTPVTHVPVKAVAQDAARASSTAPSRTVTSPVVQHTGAETEEARASAQLEPEATTASGARKGDRGRSLAREAEPAPAATSPLQPLPFERSAELTSMAAVQNAPAPAAPAAPAAQQPAPAAPAVAATRSAPQREKLAAAFEGELVSDHAESPDVGGQPFAELLQQPRPDGAQASVGTTSVTAGDVAPAEANSARGEVQPPLQVASDPDTGARVVHIEYFGAAAPAARQALDGASTAPSAPLETKPLDAGSVGELQDDARAADVSAPMDASVTVEQDASAPGEEPAARDERPPMHSDSDGRGSADPGGSAFSGQEASGRDGSQPRAQAFQATEVQGMRGIDAVVASLLRAGHEDASPAVSRPERVTFVSPTGPANTEKSQSSKSAEKAAALVDVQRKDALQREEERTLEQERAQFELPQVPVQFEARAQDQRGFELKPAEIPLPSPASPLPDPDAATMGKLARGEGVNGASIAIEHPELGPMKVLVQSENGRIDVRAVLETPRAAAVLRAHESALRYGIQQAGMTFGALRVRTRGGEPEPVKTQSTTKRRRGQEWEA